MHHQTDLSSEAEIQKADDPSQLSDVCRYRLSEEQGTVNETDTFLNLSCCSPYPPLFTLFNRETESEMSF